ncbi:MAG TPA: hypothetical protein PKH79_04565 [Prolixibacteraceae bacterium]|nr:hypothetical protein [Prolixibacteraceae bacterium]HPS12848.1 hypothetical protein [Prolixibacteraceae bacterium]
MTTVIIDTKSEEAQRLVEFLKTIKYVKVIDADHPENYNPEFVEMIKQRETQDAVKLDIHNLWK